MLESSWRFIGPGGGDLEAEPASKQKTLPRAKKVHSSSAGDLRASRSVPNNPSIPRWTLTAEIIKYCCFNVLIAILLPLAVSVPISYHEGATAAPTHHIGFTGYIGLPDLLLSCAILVWGAFRDTLDAEHWAKPVQQIFLSLTTVLGLVNIGMAVAVYNVTAANFMATSGFLASTCVAAGVLSLGISAGISIGRGVLRERNT